MPPIVVTTERIVFFDFLCLPSSPRQLEHEAQLHVDLETATEKLEVRWLPTALRCIAFSFADAAVAATVVVATTVTTTVAAATTTAANAAAAAAVAAVDK